MKAEDIIIKYKDYTLYVDNMPNFTEYPVAVIKLSHNLKKIKVEKIENCNLADFETIVLPKVEKYRDHLLSIKSIL